MSLLAARRAYLFQLLNKGFLEALIFYMGYCFWIEPALNQWTKYKRLTAEIKHLQVELDQIKSASRPITLISPYSMNQMMLAIGKIASKNKLTVLQLIPHQHGVDLTGKATYFQLLCFIQQLMRLNSPLLITALSMDNRHQLSLTLTGMH